MKILVGNAWPYANGSLHVGHIAALLPGDVIARYHRARGDDVYMVSGSDCHGTPVAIRARQEGKSPGEISGRYHREFVECFEKLGFSYDRYEPTSGEVHKEFVREFHRRMYQGDSIYEKTAPQAYCGKCGGFLADRFVVGSCPGCGSPARGDQCEACGAVLEPEALGEPHCAVCGAPPEFRDARHLYVATSKLQRELEALLAESQGWRKNAVSFTARYLGEGLRDRAVTRDLDWGIGVPKEGYEGKKIYIWAENVLGYLSMSTAEALRRGQDPAALWSREADARHYYVHGKDNIPFHTIILPALLLAHGGDWRLPDRIVSSEYLTLEGRKISTSANWAVWAKDIASRYHPDSIRYFLLTNGPEKRDTDFSWREFVHSHNGELLGAYGNLVNRTLAFLHKYGGGRVPEAEVSGEIKERVHALYPETGRRIEGGALKEALDGVFELVRFGNRYFDGERPWETRSTDPAACSRALAGCVELIANLGVLLDPFLPFSAARVRGWLGVDNTWSPKTAPSGLPIPQPELLFQRIDKGVIEEEAARLEINE